MKRMMRKFGSGVSIILFVSIYLFPAQRMGGSIGGKVVDPQGNALPGVTLTVTGPALQGQRIYVTNETGNFHFYALPPGKDYVLYVEMPGFQNLKRENLLVETGKTIKLYIVLQVSRLEEEIAVVEKSPLVDTGASKTSIRISKDLINNIPIFRDFYNVINFAPGAIPEDDHYYRTSFLSGAAVKDNLYSLDGTVINDPQFMTPMINVNIDLMEEMEIELLGHPVDMPSSGGSYINIISKSGGNDFNGIFTWEYFNKNLQTKILREEELKAAGLTMPSGLNQWSDYSLSLGGPIQKDRFWAFANVRFLKWAQEFDHIDWEQTLASNKRILTQDEVPHQEYNVFGKLSFRFSPSLNFSASHYLTSVKEDLFRLNLIDSLDRSAFPNRERDQNHVFSGWFKWLANQNLHIYAHFGYVYRNLPVLYSQYADPLSPRMYDIYYDAYYNNSSYQQINIKKRINPMLSATIYKESLFGATHEIKFGAEYESAATELDWWRENPFYFHTFRGDRYAYPLTEVPNRSKLFVYTGANAKGGSVQKNLKTRIGLYFQDSITLLERLTLNLGIRFDSSKGAYPVQSHSASADTYGILDVLPGLDEQYADYQIPEMDVLSWENFSPRLGFAYDLFGDNKTSLRASWSRYHETLLIEYFSRLNPLYPQTSEWYWTDTNDNLFPDDEDKYDLLEAAQNPSDIDLEKNLDKEATAPYTDEFALGIERDLGNDLTTGLIFIYRHNRNLFENFNDYGLGLNEAWKGYSPESPFWEKFEFQDPGDDGVFGTDDDIRSYCYAETNDSPGIRNFYYSNVELSFRKYTALQLVLNKRMSHQWQMLASLVWSKAWGNVNGSFEESMGDSNAFNTPNSFIYADGRLDYDRPLIIKIQSSVILPHEYVLSAHFNYCSGIPWNRKVTVFIPEDSRYLYPGRDYTVSTELLGTRRMSSVTTLDLRLEKRFHLTGSINIGGYIDIINALGRSGYSISSNPGGYLNYRDPLNPTFTRYGSYGKYTGVYGRRVVKLSVKLSF